MGIGHRLHRAGSLMLHMTGRAGAILDDVRLMQSVLFGIAPLDAVPRAQRALHAALSGRLLPISVWSAAPARPVRRAATFPRLPARGRR